MGQQRKTFEMEWKLHTPNLLRETINCNPTAAILYRPLQLLGQLLHEVAERAAELNDPELNHLMCKLTLYEVADPENKEAYNRDIVKEVERLAVEAKAAKRCG